MKLADLDRTIYDNFPNEPFSECIPNVHRQMFDGKRLVHPMRHLLNVTSPSHRLYRTCHTQNCLNPYHYTLKIIESSFQFSPDPIPAKFLNKMTSYEPDEVAELVVLIQNEGISLNFDHIKEKTDNLFSDNTIREAIKRCT